MAKGKGKKQNSGSAGQNRKKSEEFLTQNRNKDGIYETASGLQYEIIKQTTGAKPNTDSTVKVHQRAMLLGGKMLDDTYKDATPLEFSLEETIEGYAEGLQLMSVGSRYKFYIPPELGWGKKGSGGRIGPYALTIFDVSLIEIYD
ncbi:FKBP-type peptidyl-prolyl cis-trans isomerase [Carboxylicivirga sp. A043]|uniref:FKBP-type peptidyl-prolyl cis-trans isomerase n=1 Tax=Carboxylicivirga litoralis TaxID=2816963 RepID=UPI0021CB27E1|nr:FKBP-type peptidyl-prolyl cis-trans isomerase [Carboxylicivirga sp. A043]MCU4156310.1 FKBP-type peptidyl-prolyl cis-trans isomerase [Carboxylicivirga sp. A043]